MRNSCKSLLISFLLFANLISASGKYEILSDTTLENTYSKFSVAPIITVSTSSLNQFSACLGSASATQTFTVSGSDLNNDITINAPTGYEISLNGTSWFSNLILNQTSGSVGTTTITIRIAASASSGVNNGPVLIFSGTGGGAPNESISFNGYVINSNNILPGTISGNQTVCGPGNPATFTSTDNGNDGLPNSINSTISYIWESSINNSTWTTISGANNATYNPPAGISVTTYFRRILVVSVGNNFPCESIPSNVITVTYLNNFSVSAGTDLFVCKGQTISLNATASGTTLPISYSWTGPNFSNNSQSPTISNATISMTGNYTVTASTGSGCQVTDVVYVEVFDDPAITSPQFQNGILVKCTSSPSATSGAINFLLTIPSYSSNILNYTINWGNGSPVGQPTTEVITQADWTNSVVHLYNVGLNTFSITINYSNGCSTTSNYSAFVGSSPAAATLVLNQNQANGCAPLTTQWTFTVPNNVGGTYYIGTWGETATQDNFRFNQGGQVPTPTATMSWSNPSIDPLTLTTTYTITKTYLTSSCGINVILGNTTYYNTYQPIVITQNPCTTTPQPSGTGLVSVGKKPTASFNPTPFPPKICTGVPLQLTNTSSFGQTIPTANGAACLTTGFFYWTITPLTTVTSGAWTATGLGSNNGLTVADFDSWANGSVTPSITFNQTGTYRICLYIANSCGVDSVCKEICVQSKVTPTFTLSTTSGCKPLVAAVTNTSVFSVSCDPVEYLWAVAYTPSYCGATTSYTYLNSTSASSFAPTFQFNNPGTYGISLKTTNPCGSLTSPIQNVIVKQPPTVTINPILDYCGTAIISPTAVVNSCSNIATNNPTYLWDFPGATSIPSGATTSITPNGIVYSTPGTYTITLTVTNECGSTPTTRTFTVNPLPTITGTLIVCAGSTTQLTGSATAATTNAWLSSNTSIATVNATGLVTGVAAGTATITYTNSNGCQITASVVVNALPTITGTLNVCIGSTRQLTGSATAATTNAWLSSDTSIATVDNTGLVTGVAVGTATITYTNSNGCQRIVTFTVNPLPTITGTLNVCAGSTTQLTGSATAATTNAWLSSNTSIATVNATGLVTGVAAGTATITYTNSNGCQITASVVVNALPTITGTLNVCAGSTTQLTGSATAATTNAWLSSNTSIATVNATGLVTGVAAGTATITYTNSNGCQITASVVVNALPTITGTLNVCIGSTRQLTGSATAATTNAWLSSDTSIATVDNTGLVTGVAVGTATITYTNSNGCQRIVTFTVNPLPTITGTLIVCAGSTTQLTGSATAATTNAWLSSNTSIATVNATGLVTGVAAGTATITYTNSNGCQITASVVVNALPTITGTLNVCIGSTRQLTGSATAATTNAWLSSNTSIATVNATGLVTGVAAGTATITYTNSNGCQITASVVVNALPTITGTLNVCIGSTRQLTGSATAATTNAWLSSDTSIATVNATGLVTGVAAGTATITYTNSNGCQRIVTFTVNPLPTITGTLIVCAGSTTQLTGSATAATTNTWLSSNTSIATVNATGLVTGVAAGTATITYTNSNGCQISASVVVNALPTITGTLNVCAGSTTQLTGSATAATTNAWLSSNTSIATVNATGLVTGVAAGTATITYTNSNGCQITASVVVNALPTITGALNVCAGSTTQLTGSATAATTNAWLSSNTSIATVNATGLVTGVAAGTATITYTNSNGCQITASVVVNALPTITGTLNVCIGSTRQLTGSATAATTNAWLSSNTSIATVNATGLVTGVAAGTATITYTNSNGCQITASVVVNALPTITGTLNVCIGSTRQLTGSATAATTNAWLSSDTSIATVNATGLVTGVAAGTATITYTNSNGCQRIVTFTVNPLPTITGTLIVCAGSTTQLTGSATAATTNAWLSSNTSIATVNATGLVTGVAAGTATITYTNSNGCQITASVVVNALPTITGTLNVCIGLTRQLTGSATAATTNAWLSSDTSIATVNATGLVTGVAAGTATITYTNSNGCQITASVVVNALPTITGTLNVCAGSTTQLTGSATAATTNAWLSSNTSIATVNATGLVTGVAAGTATITYTNSNGCQRIVTFTVNPLPTITGTLIVCAGSTTQLTGSATAATTNTWLSSNTSIATVNATGLVTGVAAGTATITYTNSNGCQITASVVVNALPTITGTLNVCIGSTRQLTGSATAATTNAWLSSDTSIATVDNTGLVTGVAVGTATITYTNSNGCQRIVTFTVNPLPTITGTLIVCAGSTTQLTGSATAATTNAWLSSNTSIATVNATGLVTGVAAGTATITYTNSNGCQITASVVVNALPTITGTLIVCAGSTTQLTGSATAATTNAWLSSNTSIATVNATGLVTGVAAGTATITYTNSNGCQITASVVVNALPTFTGTLNVCIGSTRQLTGSATAATTNAWLSSDTSIATVDNTGLVAGVAVGTATITYTNSNGCQRIVTFTVNPLPTITGTLIVCAGSTTQLTGSATAATTNAWLSSNTSIATVNATGLVTGVAAGTATITYTNSNGCQITASVVVNALPTITGTLNVCIGSTRQLTGSATAATTNAWLSSDTSIATVNATGLVTGVAAGTATITYTNSNGCQRIVTFTVNPLPTITGTLIVCAGSTTQLTGSATAATTNAWLSSNTSIATVNATGLVTGVAAGTATITYTNSNGCQITASVVVNALPTITGTLNVCAGSTTQLTGSATAATTNAWLSSNTSIATVNATGLVTGVAAGTATITYTNSNGCQITASVVVNALPTITGTLNVCAGSTTQLTGSATAATTNAWLSSNTSIATVNATGLVTGVAAGTATITYTNSNGCQRIVTFTVNPLPTITGTLIVCAGSTTQLTGSATAATTNAWLSSNTSIATVNATGLVTGVAAGTATITYTNSNGCQITASVVVNALPTITGTLNVCIGLTRQLTGSATAATTNAWLSSDTSIATVDNTGLVTGVAVGTATITYTNSNGCQRIVTFTVNPLPTITGTLNVCAGSTTQLTGSATAATTNAWLSSNTSIATVNATGLVTGVAAGTATITYTNSNGCQITASVVVNALPTITGTLNVCAGSTTQLTGSATAATTNAWLSSNTSIATVNATGLVTGVAAGTATITYTNSNGCQITASVVVNALPTITGTLNVCIGSTRQLTGSATAATTNAWLSSDTSIATVDNTGLVTGVAVGTATITYTNSNGCQRIVTFTVNPLPTFTGTLNVCAGSTTQLTGSATAATTNAWLSSNTSIATVNATGLVTGVAAGTATITYTNSNGCQITASVVVNALPTITGTLNVCAGSTTQLTGSATAATTNAWLSSNTSIATVNATGLVTGVAAGTATITYTNSNGCQITASVVVNALPTITGTLNVCIGSTRQLTGSATAATTNAWLSSDTSIATVDNTGLVTGVAVGTATITYTNSNGCQRIVTFTVNPLPTITGTLIVCAGSTTQLTGSATAATTNAWLSSNTSIATVNATGLVTGVAAGTATITYTNSNGCQITASVVVNALPTITGTLNVCIGSTRQLTGSATAATTNAWLSSDTSIATVDNTGLVTGVAVGTATITYTNSNGCQRIVTFTVNPLPTFTGTLNVCAGSTTQLTGSATAATTNAWLSSNTSIATVNATGLVTGVAAGTATITYTNSNGCQITASVVVNALPTITGTLIVCAGSTTQLTGSATAATTNAWLSSNTSIATVNATGLVTGVAAGTATITYTNSNGCQITASVVVNALPTITGTLNVCIGSTRQLTGSATAATTNAWLSSDTSIATVNATGLVTGVAAGTATITYTNSNGCQITASVVVNALPTITGTLNVCAGSTTQLTGSATAATTNAWLSSNTSIATVNATGLVTGVAAGTATITYTNSNGCQITASVVVNALPTITGTLIVCAGSTTQLTGSATAATTNAWLSSNTSIATVNATGLVTGVAAGTATITYTNSNGCQITASVVVNALPTITGTLNVCAGSTTQLTGSATAATTNAWLSSNTSIATVNATGLVTGVAAGTATITYTNSNGCQITASVVVNALPTITGTLNVCAGSTTQLTGSATAATTNAWLSSNTSIATVNATGLVTGVAAGTATITYTNSNGCQITASVVVNALPTITGTLNVCIGSTRQLTGSATAATTNAWLSSDTSIATVDNTGLVTGVAVGTATITYTNSNGCQRIVTFTVNPLPTFTGTLNVCAGSTTQLTGSATAATTNAWLSSNTSIATVNATGLVTGVAAGTATITYTNSNGCQITASVVVNALPTITGTLIVCAGSTTQLTGSATAATTNAWLSSNTSIATVNATGLVTGVAAGTATITYTNSNGCQITASVVVNALPTITGTLNVCIGSTRQLTGSATAATTNAWLSSDTSIATVNATGLVTGVAAGTATITYTNSNGCQITASVVVNALPTITGTLNVCAGSTTQLTGSATAATTNAWLSSNTSIATVNATGLVTGVAAGTATITYTNSNGCQITASVVVNALPTITGTLNVCAGSTTQLTGSATAATTNAWLSSNTSIATVNATGLVTGVAAGTATITYTNSNGCQITASVVVNALPTITGTLNVCAGSTTQLTGSATAATTNAWLSSNTSIATVNATGLVTGVAAGTATITYTNSNGCQITASVVVNALPTITGTLNVCAGSTTQLTGSATAATTNAWLSSNTSIATVNATGLVTGVAAGTATITYTNSNGCQSIVTFTVNPTPFIPNTPQLTDTRCSGDRFNIIPLNGIPTSATIVPTGTTYTWTVPINNLGATSLLPPSSSSISQVLNNPTNTIQSIIYTVTPVTGTCVGLPFDVKVWVEPKPYIPAVLETICDNTEFILNPIHAQVPTPSTIIPTITKYTWVLPTFSGGVGAVTGASTGTNALFFQSGTLNNTTPIVQTVIFQVYPSYYVTSNPNVVQCAGDPFTVTVRVNPNVTPNATITNVLCYNSVPLCAGSIVLNPTGASPFRYLWTSSNPVNAITNPGARDQFNLCPGNYTVAITDLYNCTYTFAPFTIAPPTPITESVVIHQNISCNNINVPPCDGYIQLAISGGTPLSTATLWGYNYYFEWYRESPNNPNNFNILVATGTPILPNACEGNYRLKVTDANGCIFWSQTHTILKLFVPTSIVETISNYNGWSIKCNGESNGFIRTVISGGSGSYNYTFVNNANPGVIIFGTFGIPRTVPQLDFNGLPAGNYTLTITDTACPFSITRNYTLTQPPVLLSTVTPVAAILCNGGFATYQVVASGGTPFGSGNPYNYLWSPPSSETTPIATNLPAGPYAVTVTDANGCQVIKNGVITQPALLVPIATITTPISCFGLTGVVNISAVGGTPSYTINGGDYGNYPVTFGSRNFTVIDANGCQKPITINVTQPPLLQVSAVITTPIRCFGGLATVTVTATGGTPSSTGPAYTNIGTFQVGAGIDVLITTVTDANGCSQPVRLTITEPPLLVATALVTSPILCNGGTGVITVSGQGGTPFASSPFYTGIGPITVSAGNPSPTITDANGCTASVTINVTQPTPVVATATIISPIKCHGGTAIISVTATGGVPGNVYTGIGNFIVSANTATTPQYCYTVRDGNNCISNSPCVTVTEPPLLVATAAVTSPILCNGGTATVTVTVSGGTPAYTITENGPPPPNLIAGSNVFTISNVLAGPHPYIITDANLCTTNATINVTQPGPLAFTIKSANNPNCFPNRLYNNGSICITVTGGTSPRPVGPGWVNTPALSNDWCLTGLSPGTYTIAVEDINNCPSTTRTVTLTRPTALTAFVTSNINVDCPTKNVSQTNIAFASGGVPGYFYTWSGGTACAGPPNPQCMTTSINGSYTVDVNDQEGVSLGCIPIQVPVTVNLPMIGNPLMSISSSAMSICGIYSINDPISFTNVSTGNYTTIQWYIDGILQTSVANTVSHLFTSVGEHSITLVVNYTIGGVTCTYSVTEKIQVTRGYDMVVPNAFTPANHDGINDNFRPEYNCMKEVEMRVYDTWGSLLYIESGATLKGWDGTINGHESENGNYIIVVKATTLFGAVIDYNGPFTLLK